MPQPRKSLLPGNIPLELRGQIHTTVMSPDGRYVYITGAKYRGVKDEDYGEISAENDHEQ